MGVVGEKLESELVVLGHALQLDQLVARAVGGDQRAGVPSKYLRRIRKPLALCVPLRRKSAKKTASNTGGTHKKP